MASERIPGTRLVRHDDGTITGLRKNHEYFDLSNDAHVQIWARSEAEREYDCCIEGTKYLPKGYPESVVVQRLY